MTEKQLSAHKSALYRSFFDYMQSLSPKLLFANRMYVKSVSNNVTTLTHCLTLDTRTSDDLVYFKMSNHKMIRCFAREKRRALNDFFVGTKRQYAGSFYMSKQFAFCYNLN